MFDRIFAPRSRRPQTRRRPQIEAMEGKMLLSGIIGNHIGVTAAAVAPPIQGAHIGVVAEGIVGSHIGTNVAVAPPIQGAHIGMSVADVATPEALPKKQ